MASTILMKFYEFLVVSTPNYRFFRKIHETRKLFFNLLSVLVKTGQSLSNSIYILQISPACFSILDKPLKLRAVHIRKKFKISIFSKMAPTILIKFCGFTVGPTFETHSRDTFGFSRKKK